MEARLERALSELRLGGLFSGGKIYLVGFGEQNVKLSLTRSIEGGSKMRRKVG